MENIRSNDSLEARHKTCYLHLSCLLHIHPTLSYPEGLQWTDVPTLPVHFTESVKNKCKVTNGDVTKTEHIVLNPPVERNNFDNTGYWGFSFPKTKQKIFTPYPQQNFINFGNWDYWGCWFPETKQEMFHLNFTNLITKVYVIRDLPANLSKTDLLCNPTYISYSSSKSN